MNKLIILLILSMVSFHAYAISSLDYEICRNKEYLACINTNTQKCIAANEQAEKICLERFPIDLDVDEKDEAELARKFGKCRITNYIKLLGVTNERFEQCGVHLESTFSEYLNIIQKRRNKYNEDFHKYE